MSQAPELPWVCPPHPIYRIGRKPDPWQPPDWALADPATRTFGNRFDDSRGHFRVLYASSSRLGCFLETLARFRASPPKMQILTKLNSISHSDSNSIAPSTLPASWLTRRCMGSARLRTGRYARIYSAEWLAHLRQELEPELVSTGGLVGINADFDLHLLLSQKRGLTQCAATKIAALGYSGICYESRHGLDVVNWALFEPFKIENKDVKDLTKDDSDLRESVRMLSLEIASHA